MPRSRQSSIPSGSSSETPQTDDALEVQSGQVLWHSQDRDEVYRKAVELRPQRFAMLYTDRMPEDTAIIL
ncbi:MAG TPA: hypothetical protein VGS22_06360 [Thermoanaerobaculia bacterium]|nr:hypothetical protein [Thermoanaerobaculia bacterium]